LSCLPDIPEPAWEAGFPHPGAMVTNGGISALNRVLSSVPKRAEGRQAEQLRETFVDSGVAAALESIDHQVLYGRRGTGKTHAFRYLQTIVQVSGSSKKR
jgi:hypothetical protein